MLEEVGVSLVGVLSREERCQDFSFVMLIWASFSGGPRDPGCGSRSSDGAMTHHFRVKRIATPGSTSETGIELLVAGSSLTRGTQLA